MPHYFIDFLFSIAISVANLKDTLVLFKIQSFKL